MSKSRFADRRTVDAFVHTGTVELMLCQARFVDDLILPDALAAAIAARSPAERKALARLGRTLMDAAQLAATPSTPA
ncbi:hypothetical protein [Methylobacterium bullatum]|uniref:Uncharacterized protein n=1 Tax=Methylobacterium bullatum TaxID=570505 RepID=A0AAV4ZB78_9HYPH|nr:hypothetical protein [Methylobacterium bullatum]MBD8904549.1 hypothetical protein [Methylobacterium bullatum]GJD40858.1 hypothetical protein OICFNHDK_3334 [Methylobacterium bullatum]